MADHYPPSISTSMGDALNSNHSNKYSKSLGRNSDNRLEPECWPIISPSFNYSKKSTFFAIGSCFARNLEDHLIENGYKVGGHELIQSTNALGRIRHNRYTPASIKQEMAWTAGIFFRDDIVTERDAKSCLLEIKPGKWVDLYYRQIVEAPTGYHALVEARMELYNWFRHAFTADVVIITLGLIESWWDTVTKSYVELHKDFPRHLDPGRLRFTRLGFDQSYRYVSDTIDLLQNNNDCKILLTTSPVPLSRTFTKDDVIVANSYSKSVLRSVAGEISEKYQRVDYFPSYENVVLSKMKSVWENDLIHVEPGFVKRIMERVNSIYDASSSGEYLLPTIKDTAMKLVNLERSLDLENQNETFNTYDQLQDEIFEIPLAAAHVAGAKISLLRNDLSRVKRHLGMIDHADVEKFTTQPDLLFSVSNIYEALGDAKNSLKALNSFNSACDNAPRSYVKTFISLRRRNLHKEAATYINFIIDKEIFVPDLSYQISKYFFKQEKPKQALAECDRYLKHDPISLLLLHQKSKILMSLKRHEEAATTLNKIAKISPEDTKSRLLEIWSLISIPDLERSEKASESMISDFPNHPGGYTFLSKILLLKGDKKKANELTRKAMSIASDTP